MKKLPHALALTLLLFGCTNYFLPSSTSRTVAASDLTGTWSYDPIDVDAAVTLVLDAEGTFRQTVTLESETLTADGTWEVEGAEILLDGVLEEFNGWEVRGAAWQIIDQDESPTGFAILGGAVDPDTWVILRWVP